MVLLGGAFTLNDGPISELLRTPWAAAATRETPGAAGALSLLVAVLLISALMLAWLGRCIGRAARDGDHRHLGREIDIVAS